MTKKTLTVVLLTILVSLTLTTTALAWTAPAGSPPGNEAPAPLNVSDADQIKQGGLMVGTNNVSLLRAFTGFIAGGLAGNGVAETQNFATAGLKAQVLGKFAADLYCNPDGQDCKTLAQLGGVSGGPSNNFWATSTTNPSDIYNTNTGLVKVIAPSLNVTYPGAGTWNAGALKLIDSSNNKAWIVTNRGELDTGDRNKLMFQHYNGSNWGDVMTLDTAGQVGIGIANPEASLQVARTGTGYQFALERTGSNAHKYGLAIGSTDGSFILDDITNGLRRLRVATDGVITVGALNAEGDICTTVTGPSKCLSTASSPSSGVSKIIAGSSRVSVSPGTGIGDVTIDAADNLGNHTATQNLNLNGSALINVSQITARSGASQNLDLAYGQPNKVYIKSGTSQGEVYIGDSGNVPLIVSGNISTGGDLTSVGKITSRGGDITLGSASTGVANTSIYGSLSVANGGLSIANGQTLQLGGVYRASWPALSCTSVTSVSNGRASCAVGYTLTGGGATCSNNYMAYSRPDGNDWIAGCWGGSSATVYATCCKLQ